MIASCGTRKDALSIVENGQPKILRRDYAGPTEIDTTLLDVLLRNGFLRVLTSPELSTAREATNVDGD